MTNNKCVYLHKDKEGIIRYVGSGNLSRANTTHANSDRGAHYAEHVNTNGKLKVEIISEGLTKVEAENLERELYDKYKDTVLNSRRPFSDKSMTKEMFDEYLYYDETSKSCLRWRVDVGRNNKTKANSEAGSFNNQGGYYIIRLNRKSYLSHRIIAIFHGLDVDGKVVDHIDRVKTNNKIKNLRLVSHQENSYNKNLASNSTSGVSGVNFHKQSNRWSASWSENQMSRRKYFPVYAYTSTEEAKQAAVEYRRKMIELHYKQ